MKHAKKLLVMVAVVVLVMTTGMGVALGEPTATSSASASPSPSPSESETTSPDASSSASASATFSTLDLNAEGEYVIRLQMRLRDLGYFNYRATGMYYNMTQKGVKQFQEQNGLSPDGQAGQLTYDALFKLDAARKSLSASVVPAVGPGMTLTTPVYGELSSWTEIDALFTDGMTVTVTDFNTGTTFQMKRTGGANHADVETVTADDTDKFLDCFGDKSNWGEKRPVLVTIGGVQYAASLYAHPSGAEGVEDNDTSGHTQLYFNGSTSDILGFADKYHNDNVQIAAGKLTP